jgi:hypothetical protein
VAPATAVLGARGSESLSCPDAVERFVVALTDPPGLAVAFGRPRWMRVVRAWWTRLTPAGGCLRTCFLQNVGDDEQHLRLRHCRAKRLTAAAAAGAVGLEEADAEPYGCVAHVAQEDERVKTGDRLIAFKSFVTAVATEASHAGGSIQSVHM